MHSTVRNDKKAQGWGNRLAAMTVWLKTAAVAIVSKKSGESNSSGDSVNQKLQSKGMPLGVTSQKKNTLSPISQHKTDVQV